MMRVTKKIGVVCSLLVLAIFLVMVKSHAATARFLHLNVQEGLSQGSVFAIAQDYQGFMWIGTRDGLNKFDARKITIYRNDKKDSTSLTHSFVQHIFEDSEKRLWVGTMDGLNLYDRKMDRFVRVRWSDLNRGEIRPAIFHMLEDKQKNIFAATSNGLYCLRKEDKESAGITFEKIQLTGVNASLLSQDIRYLYISSSGQFWMCTNEKLVLLKPSSPTEAHMTVGKIIDDPQSISRSFPNKRKIAIELKAICEVLPGILWIATKGDGIRVYNTNTGQTQRLQQDANGNSLPSDDVRSLFKDKTGGIWIGTFNGLVVYKEKQFKIYQTGANLANTLSDNSIRPIFQDRRGSIWIGTYYGGVNILDKDMPAFNNYTQAQHGEGLSFPVVSSFAELANGNLIIGTEGGGLNYLNRRNNDFSAIKYSALTPKGLSHNHVKALCLDRDGDLWVGTYDGGLNLQRKGRRDFEHFLSDQNGPLAHNSVYAITEDRHGAIWIGTFGGGLQRITKKNGKLLFDTYNKKKGNLRADNVRAIYEDKKGNLWLGTQNGLFVKKEGAENFVHVPYADVRMTDQVVDDVVSIHEDAKGRLWIGTYMNGLNLLNPLDGSFKHVDTRDGLPGNNIFGILHDRHGNIWLSTNNGIACFNPDKGTVRSYNYLDGLVGNEFSRGAALALRDGSFAFGGFSGFTIFHPDSLRNSTFVPPVQFTGLKLFNRPVRPDSAGILQEDISVSDQLILNYHQNVFSVEFSVLNFIHAERNKYAYMLKGFDTEWNYVDVPVATYTNLDPGVYELLVKGANNDGVWNPSPRVLKIRVLVPPWKTWWAYLLYVAIFSTIAYYISRFFIERSRLRQKLLLEQIALENEKKTHEDKLFFFSSVSHEIRTPLSLITGPIDKLQSDRNLSDQSRQYLHTAAKHTERLLALVDQLLLFQKTESEQVKLDWRSVDLGVFLRDICEKFADVAAEKQIVIQLVRHVSATIRVQLDPEKMEKIVSNLLTNALKFTEQGQIVVSYGLHHGKMDNSSLYYYISVSDSGTGISTADQYKIFDKFYQSSQKATVDTGFGIGLALVKSLVTLHGGTISVKSGLAKFVGDINTVFEIRLPLPGDHVPPAAPQEEVSHVFDAVLPPLLQEEQLSSGREVRPLVLVVEDNVELRRFIKASLVDKFDVLEAGNGEEAWSIVETEQPDVVLSDMVMPKMGGIDLVKAIKSHRHTDHIPVLLLTARTASVSEIEAFTAGVDDYITKPFRVNILLFKINNILKTRKNLEERFVQHYLIRPKEEEAKEITGSSFLAKIVAVVEANLTKEDFSVQDMADAVHLSRATLYRKVKQVSAVNLVEFITIVRLKKAAQLLEADPRQPISEVAYQVGFSDPKYFSKSFRKFFKQSPSEYQRKNRTEES